MEMHMHHFLPLIFSSMPFDHFPDIKFKSISRDTHTISQITSQENKSGDQLSICILEISDRLDVSLGDEEHMDPGFWMDIIDDEILLILVHRGCWDVVIDNRTEKAHKKRFRIKFYYSERVYTKKS